ncbi:MAG: nucleotidyltransferase family protein [Gammaproteobacteria bacterium]
MSVVGEADAGAVAAVVLAGERPGGSPLARAEGVSAGVLVDVAGQPALGRVVTALRGCSLVASGIVVGPAGEAPDDPLTALLAPGDFTWIAPAGGPSASAIRALDTLQRWPVLLTAGDHALLTAGIVDEFVRAAMQVDADCVVGLVPWTTVKERYPGTRRTVLGFSDGDYCGSNLFLLQSAAARRVLEFWSTLEADRKRPWRLAARLGVGTLLRYFGGRLSITAALARLSRVAGARCGFVEITHARAAIDVDSSADLALAREILEHG